MSVLRGLMLVVAVCRAPAGAALILQCGARVEGVVEVGETHEYCFDAAAGEVVSISLEPDGPGYMYFHLFAPSGELQGSFNGRNDLPVTETGRHTLRVFEDGLNDRREYTLEFQPLDDGLPAECSERDPGRLPGDCNGDVRLDISDAVCVFRGLFVVPDGFPCGDRSSSDPANLALLDWDGSGGALNLPDGVAVLLRLFRGGPPHPLAVPGSEETGCVPIPGCPPAAGCGGFTCPSPCDVAQPCGHRVRVVFEAVGLDNWVPANDTDRQALVSVYEPATDTLHCPVPTDADGVAMLPCAEPPLAITAQIDTELRTEDGPALFRMAGTVLVDEAGEDDVGILMPGLWDELSIPGPPLEITGTIRGIPPLDLAEELVVYAEAVPDGERRSETVTVAPGASTADFTLTVGPGTYKVWAVIRAAGEPEYAPVHRLAALLPDVVSLADGPRAVDLSFAAGDGQRVEFDLRCLHLNGALGKEATEIEIDNEIVGPAGQQFFLSIDFRAGPLPEPPASLEGLSVATQVPPGFTLAHALEIRYHDGAQEQEASWIPPHGFCGSGATLGPFPAGGVSRDSVSDPWCVELSGPGAGEILVAHIEGPGGGLESAAPDGRLRAIDAVGWLIFPDQSSGADAKFCLPRTPLRMLAAGPEYEIGLQSAWFLGDPPVTWREVRSFDLNDRARTWRERRSFVNSRIHARFSSN